MMMVWASSGRESKLSSHTQITPGILEMIFFSLVSLFRNSIYTRYWIVNKQMTHLCVDFRNHLGSGSIVIIGLKEQLPSLFIQGWLSIWDNQQTFNNLRNTEAVTDPNILHILFLVIRNRISKVYKNQEMSTNC